MTIVEFLSARWAEEEADAQKAAEEAKRYGGELWVVTGSDNAVGVFYDPARVLREVAAKRVILDEVVRYLAEWEFEFGTEYLPIEEAMEQIRAGTHMIQLAKNPAIQALAAAYADHPDYNKDWAS